MKYLVSRQSQQSEPLALEEIAARVRAKELDLFDYIYDLEKDDWVLLMEFAPLAAKLRTNKPSKPPQVGTGTTDAETKTEVAQAELADEAVSEITQVTKTAIAMPTPTVAKSEPVEVNFHVAAHTIIEWYVLKGENRFGPFNHTDLVRMLQQKVVFPFDFVWHAGMDTWKRVGQVADFDSANIRKMFVERNVATKEDIFVARQFPRRKFNGRLIVHDGMTLWRGDGVEISRGGVGVTMQNAKVLPGQQLTLHFTQQSDWPAFNAVCEVVSKKILSDNKPVEYGLRFLSMTRETQEEFYKKVA